MSRLLALFARPFSSILMLLVLIIGMVIGAALDNWTHENTKAKLARLQAQHADALAQARDAALIRLQDANQRADQLQITLHQTEQQLTQLSETKRHALQTYTTGRPCFNAGLVRLLNADEGSAASALSETTSKPVAVDAAVATDTDVALWTINAREQYDSCRARRQALIDWHQDPMPREQEHPHD